MKKINIYMLLAAFIFPLCYVNAQLIDAGSIRVDQPEVIRNGNNVSINFNFDVNNTTLGQQEMIIITPILKSADNMVIQTYQPIVVTGSKRDKALNRSIDFGKYQMPVTPQMIVRRNDIMGKTIPVRLNIPYSESLHSATLVLGQEMIGCACEQLNDGQYPILTPVLPVPFVPNYELTYVTPPAEEVKQRSETYSAHLNFVVGKYELLRDFKDNRRVLNEVDMIINEIRNDDNLTVTNFTITGYASPEGNPESNMKLSENRARSFVNYLVETYNIPASSMITNWKGEDWEGLRKAVAASNVADREQILSILDNETNVMTRKNRIHQLSGGETYRTLLRDYYPPLRRNEYTISYVARPFSIDEAKVLIRTKPQHLSLNEMFLVANTYPKDSREFKEVFDIAARIYPNDPVNQINTAALEIETGNIDGAISRLQQINTPEAWNNLGIAYTKKEDYRTAQQYFERASSAGLRSATINRDQLQKVIDEM
ncbi:MAG TPA: hypothetical protein DIT04_12495 [Dysgonomonas sp.]|nr:hypothetical protein [Dysgonomonas sp.]